MEKSNRHSAGGVATALKSRKAAISRYYENPSVCKNCRSVIDVKDNEKVSSVRKKSFCNRNCSATFNNLKREKKIKVDKPKNEKIDLIGHLTKGEIFTRYKTYQSARSAICKHARRTFNIPTKERCCKICGYSNHTDIAHVKSVASFDDAATIAQINSPENLIALCPNHHWEFDSGFIKI